MSKKLFKLIKEEIAKNYYLDADPFDVINDLDDKIRCYTYESPSGVQIVIEKFKGRKKDLKDPVKFNNDKMWNEIIEKTFTNREEARFFMRNEAMKLRRRQFAKNKSFEEEDEF